MKWVRRLWPILCAAYLGCAADGGPVGTGISSATSSISGNVIDVQTSSGTETSAADTTVPSVRVTIDEVSGAQATTDDTGSFQLSGNFSGQLTLRFTVPQFQVTQLVDVPSNSAIVLQDIELAPDGVQTQAARQLDFNGRVALVDCADGTLLVDDPQHGDAQFLVRLTEETAIVGGDGRSIACNQINHGDNVAIEGAIQLQTDRTVTAVTVTVGPPASHGGPPSIQDVPLRGDIASLNCNGGFIVIDDDVQRTRLRITSTTILEGPDGMPLRCASLHLGDPVRGDGRIDLRMPGTINALHIVVAAAPPPGLPLRFFGFVTNVDCTTGVLQLADVSSVIRIHLLPTTMILRGKGNQPGQCSDISSAARVTGEGSVSTTIPGAIDAVTLTFTRRDGPQGPPVPKDDTAGGSPGSSMEER